MGSLPTQVGRVIRHGRLEQGLTLEDLAERVGVTAGALSHIESGRRLPSPRNAVNIANALGLSADVVLRALDQDHVERRETAAFEDSPSRRDTPSDRSMMRSSTGPSYRARPIEELFDAPVPKLSAPSELAASMPAPSREEIPSASLEAPRFNRSRARFAEDPSERLIALEQLADSASDAIRTLRGLLDDEDPLIRRESRRLLRELDVRLPEE